MSPHQYDWFATVCIIAILVVANLCLWLAVLR